MSIEYDVIIVGAGHAGTEAAVMCARLGARALLITSNLDTIGKMSCNPAIGGIAKGTVVREIDALGGLMGRAADRATIQFRMLNRSKGPAVWAPRAQCDRTLYRRAVRELVEGFRDLDLTQGMVARLVVHGDQVGGVETTDGRRFTARAVIITAGTFLRGRIHVGTDTTIPAGRAGDQPAVDVAQHIAALGLTVSRFKTGTPPRVDGRTVDWSKVERQDGDEDESRFSFYERVERPRQLPCWITWAGEAVKAIIERHLKESALYGGAISGRGPRYCPSVEDKVVKFPDAKRHQVFLEPEGLDTAELYVNGLSTSLPVQVQVEFVHAVPGLERARLTRPGYAIEYDYYPPTQLAPWLETKAIEHLWFAGQINGTTGYEEAAGQGVVAGINAVRRIRGHEPVVLGRDDAYIGVLVDDLVTRGVDEPYRLFTSRSEFRLLLRQDNALRRLLPLAETLGLLTASELRVEERRLGREEEVLAGARETTITPPQAAGAPGPTGTKLVEPGRVASLAQAARIPGVSPSDLHNLVVEAARWRRRQVA